MPTREDVAVLLRALYEGTRDHRLAWTKQEANLELELSDDYSVVLGPVDEMPTKTIAEDHLIRLFYRKHVVWTLTRTDLRDLSVLAEWAGQQSELKGGSFPFTFLSRLRRSAEDDASEGSSHVSIAGRLAKKQAAKKQAGE